MTTIERIRGWFSRARSDAPAGLDPPVSGLRCPHCDSLYYIENRIFEQQVVNPHGEYVEGYGHALVVKQKVAGVFYRCAACGWDSRGNDTIISREQMDAL
jgi:DNA-directed RNA polymerase subunit RPC12/RpoP